MPGFWINGGSVAGTIDYYRQGGNIPDEERGPLYRTSQQWDYQRRMQQSIRDPYGFGGGWSWGGGFLDAGNATGGAGADSIWGDDNLANAFGAWEPWRLGDKGYTRPYYIYGTVYDANGNPVAGASIESVVTSTDLLDGRTTTDGTGAYQAPCYNRTAAHYIEAYKTGSPDTAGMSNNTLTPSV